MSIKDLMFGWEFPPHIAGGLGTASYGLTKGLAKHGVKVMFVMPKAGGDEDQSVVKIINASDVEMMSEYSNLDEYCQNVNFMEIGSNLVPYLDPETFERTVKETIKTGEHSEHIVFRKCHSTVYYDNTVIVLKCCDIHSNLFQTTQRNDL